MRIRGLIALLAVPVIAVGATFVMADRAATTEPTPLPPLVGPGRVVPGDEVPWDRVGEGWYLASLDEGPRSAGGWIRPRRQMLDLVNPRGGRYRMLTTAVRHGRGHVRLADWSLDGRTALLTVGAGGRQFRAVAVDLRTGRRHPVHLTDAIAEVALRADGGGVLATTYGDARPDSRELLAIDWAGAQRTVARGLGSNVLVSRDGDLVVTGPQTTRGRELRVIDTTSGEEVGRVGTPAACEPYRWWEPGVVAARCWGEQQSLQIWAIPLDGTPATQLSTYHGRRSDDLGDLDARLLGGRTYLQASGPCGDAFLARQEVDGSATTVEVPAATGNVYLVDATAEGLVIRHDVSCAGGGTRSLLTHLDPVTLVERSMVRLPADQAFARVLVSGERPVMGY